MLTAEAEARAVRAFFYGLAAGILILGALLTILR